MLLFCTVLWLVVPVFAQNGNCSTNEVFKKCGSKCVLEPTCQKESKTSLFDCKESCVERCVCDESKGYIRDRQKGKCVKKTECPATCGPNEVWGCKWFCKNGTNCNVPSNIDPMLCEGCQCDASQGYTRSEFDASCIKKNNALKPCGSNEKQRCELRWLCKEKDNCDIAENVVRLFCITRCDCVKGYVRNEKEICIKKDSSTKNCTRNEVFEKCASACTPEATCQKPKPTGPHDCKKACVPRCECDTNKGYIRDHNGKCVKKDSCSTTEKCQSNEIYQKCASKCKPERTCQKTTPTTLHGCKEACVGRCECDGSKMYIRDKPKGKCVKEVDCPKTCGPNEAWSCDWLCKNKTHCKIPSEFEISNCEESCNCDASRSYVRSEKDGTCVKKNDTLKACGLHERNSCESRCKSRNDCEFPEEIKRIYCVEKCICIDGYTKAKNGTCIKENSSTKNCTTNEVFKECASACTSEPTCEKQSLTGSHECKKPCVHRCECNTSKGYIRDSHTGKCVKKDKCSTTPEKCKQHEILNKCGSKCVPEQTCQKWFTKREKSCKEECVKRCECDRDNGYIRNQVTGTCIEAEKCPGTCPTKECNC